MSFHIDLPSKPVVKSLRFYHELIDAAYPGSGFYGLMKSEDLYVALFEIDPSAISNGVVDLWLNSSEPDLVDLVPVIEGE